jgi:hypothetical protein
MNVIEGNPYVDEVIPWDDQVLGQYRIVYNPHGDRILPGHWGRNSNSILSDFYWKILDVEPDDFFIARMKPEIIEGFTFGESLFGDFLRSVSNIDKLCIVHTTGGDPQFRTYKYMADVCEGLQGRYITMQVGGADDYPAGADLDLRGKLSFQESAWVMSKASLAVTVDSFISHLAGALGIPQVCLFGSGNALVVRPNQIKGELVCLCPDYIRDCPGLGPCSASVRDCPTPCTGIHDPKTILESIEEIERNHHEEGCHSVKFSK